MIAKVFQSGNSLALRLPKLLNFRKDDEVKITKIGKSVIITPIKNDWNGMFEAIDSFDGEIKREELNLQERNFD